MSNEAIKELVKITKGLSDHEFLFAMQEIMARRNLSHPPKEWSGPVVVGMMLKAGPKSKRRQFTALALRPKEPKMTLRSYLHYARQRMGAWGEFGGCEACQLPLVGAMRIGQCPVCDAGVEMT